MQLLYWGRSLKIISGKYTIVVKRNNHDRRLCLRWAIVRTSPIKRRSFRSTVPISRISETGDFVLFCYSQLPSVLKLMVDEIGCVVIVRWSSDCNKRVRVRPAKWIPQSPTPTRQSSISNIPVTSSSASMKREAKLSSWGSYLLEWPAWMIPTLLQLYKL